MVKIAPSILAADFNCLERDIIKLERAGADYIHVDVMDGKFVPNITFGPVVVKNIKKISSLPLDVHLMIYEPERFVEEFVKAGAKIITIQYESTQHLDRVIRLVKSFGINCGVAVNPGTAVENILPVLSLVDMVLIMSVNPGFGGQTFIPYCLDKIISIKKAIEDKKLKTLIEVDGGITEQNVAEVTRAGADIVVAGSAVFNSGDMEKAIFRLKQA